MTLIACASSVGYVMALTQMPAKITAFFLTISDNKYVILFLINILLLVLGMPGGHGAVDPDLHADSPAGDDQFRGRSGAFRHDHDAQSRHRAVSPAGRRDLVRRLRGREGHIEEVMRKIWPFYAVMFAVLMLVTYVPALSLWLPARVVGH